MQHRGTYRGGLRPPARSPATGEGMDRRENADRRSPLQTAHQGSSKIFILLLSPDHGVDKLRPGIVKKKEYYDSRIELAKKSDIPLMLEFWRNTQEIELGR